MFDEHPDGGVTDTKSRDVDFLQMTFWAWVK